MHDQTTMHSAIPVKAPEHAAGAGSARIRMRSVADSFGKSLFATLLATSLCANQLVWATAAQASENATFTIEAKDNAQPAYKVYRVFKADISANAGADGDFPPASYPPELAESVISWPGIASHMSWASDTVRDATLGHLDADGYKAWVTSTFGAAEGTDAFAFQHGLPQNAAEYIAERIGASSVDMGAATAPATPAARSFALELARTLAAAGAPSDTTSADANGNAVFTGEEGYYLFLTDLGSVSATEAGDEAATSPIWVPLGGATSRIVEKSAIPTLDKQVREDATGAWGKVADANRGQELDYRLVATMPDNIGGFDSYYLKFTDTLPAGLALAGGNTSSVSAVLRYSHGGNTYDLDITKDSNVSIGYAGNILVVAVKDLKAIHSGIGKDAVVTVGYKAHITDAALIGQAGNQNSAVLTYAADPASAVEGKGSWDAPDPDGTSTTLEGAHKTRTCTWEINPEKLDKQTHVPLAGARYTVQVAAFDAAKDSAAAKAFVDTASVGKYVQADGSLADTAHEFSTAADGSFEVPRVDSGIYVIHESAAPSGYELQDADIRLAILPAMDQTTGSVTAWTLAVSGGEGSKTEEGDVVTHLAALDAANPESALSAALAEGSAQVVTSDDKKVVMPITGMDGTQTALLLAGGVLVVSIVGLYRNRRRDGDVDNPTEG